MKKLYFLLPCIAVPAAIFLMGYHTGSPGGRTGSPGDSGNTCTGCHTGNATTTFGWITTNVPASGFVGGQTYTLTATGTHNGVVRFGFELTVEDSQGNKVGSLQITDPTRTKLINGNHAVTHTANGITPNGNSNSWSVNWTAPTNVLGNIGIYAAFNAANGNGNTSGDVIYKSVIFISPYTPPPPALASIIPDQADQGESFQATITGTNTNFTGSPAVSMSYSQNSGEVINATSVTVITATELQAQFTIPFQASPGLWELHVNTLTLSDAFTVNLLSGIDDLADNNPKIYPNPASQRIYVENANQAKILVFDSGGQFLMNQEITADNQSIDISSFSRGLYFIRIRIDGVERIEKLIIN